MKLKMALISEVLFLNSSINAEHCKIFSSNSEDSATARVTSSNFSSKTTNCSISISGTSFAPSRSAIFSHRPFFVLFYRLFFCQSCTSMKCVYQNFHPQITFSVSKQISDALTAPEFAVEERDQSQRFQPTYDHCDNKHQLRARGKGSI